MHDAQKRKRRKNERKRGGGSGLTIAPLPNKHIS